jgi:hypothetical protein
LVWRIFDSSQDEVGSRAPTNRSEHAESEHPEGPNFLEDMFDQATTY